MKSITEEHRQELLEWIPEHIEWVRDDVKKSSYARKVTLALEIALASLTAEPGLYANFVEICDSYGPEIDRRVYPDELSALKSKDDHGGEVFALYTAPPVPVIKLPDEILPMGQDNEYDSGHNEGWNDCLAEVNRLNGWKAND